jgi:predicted NACHT family NTPase
LIDELNLRYQVPRRIGKAWMAAEQVLPLLDGLDEVALEHRAACVDAINVFRQQHWLIAMVVCSRSHDYTVSDEIMIKYLGEMIMVISYIPMCPVGRFFRRK